MAVSAKPPVIDPSTLPLSSASDLFVAPATPEEHEQTWQLNEDEWKGPLSASQYYGRERYLIARDLTKNGGITAWILTSSKLPLNPDGTRQILSACETILKSAYVANNGRIDLVRSHGIGSVYTRPEYRGKGYAGRMMTELGKQLETFQQLNGDRGSFSVLFSDVGRKFYARYGWKALPSTHIHLAPVDRAAYEGTKIQFPTVQDVTEKELKQVPTTAYFEETLKTVSRQSPQLACVAFKPDMLHFDWHWAREDVQTQLIGLSHPQIKGAIHEHTGIAMIWCRMFASKPQDWSLHVLHTAIPPSLHENPTEEVRNAISALLLRAQHEANTWDMAAGVQVWDPSELIISAAQSLRTEEQGKIEVIRRDSDHICSLRWNGPEFEDDKIQDVKWVNIEKYTWC